MSKRNNTLWSTILVTLLVLSFVLVGCTPPAAAPAPAAEPTKAPVAAPTEAPAAAPTEAPAASGAVKAMDPKDIKLAGIVFQDDQFMNTMVKGYKAAADKYGVSIVTANTNNDQAKETELIQTYMAQGLSGLAISPISEVASIPNLQEANKKGMAIAVANTTLKDTSFTTGSYTSDNKQNGLLVGAKAAEFIKANLKGPVNIGILEFDSLLPEQSKDRWGGFLDGLKAGRGDGCQGCDATERLAAGHCADGDEPTC